MGIKRVDINLCNGCGICVEHCPLDVLRMNEATNKAFIKYIRDCQSCLLCEIECPVGAITVMPVFERRMPLAW